MHGHTHLRTGSEDNYVDGLYIKNGRLINDRMDSMTGIQQAANMKRIIKRIEK